MLSGVLTIDSGGWFVLVGALMLAMGLTAPLIRRLPVTTAIVYLVVGLVIGPTGLGLFHFNPLEQSALLEILTEMVVLLSLFSAGVKMPVPVSFRHWRVPVLLATVSMAVSVGLVAGFAHWVFGMSMGAAVLLGAIVAPTDPVLATEVQIRHGKDRDRLRFTLTCEAGMNDGTAFPFVMLGLGLLGLHELGNGGQRWLVMDLAWATLSAIVIGVAAGWGLAQVGARLRGQRADPGLLDDFLGLGLIGLVYGICLWIDAWGSSRCLSRQWPCGTRSLTWLPTHRRLRWKSSLEILSASTSVRNRWCSGSIWNGSRSWCFFCSSAACCFSTHGVYGQWVSPCSCCWSRVR